MRRILGVAAAVVAINLVAAGPAPTPALANQIRSDKGVPWQFLSKLSTEAYGVSPDQAAWADDVAVFRAQGCTTAALADRITHYFTSARFTSVNYPTTLPQWTYARVIALHRAALNREVDQATMERMAGDLAAGTVQWADVVADVVGSAEFAGPFTAKACGTDGSERWPNYGFTATHPTPVPPIPAGVVGFRGKAAGQTQADLQTLLRDPAVTVVELAPQAVVEITSTLYVPSGKTLRTAGSPGPDQYALQARLVRVRNFGYAMLAICDAAENILYSRGVLPAGCDSARVEGIWVDGNRTGPNDSGGTIEFSLQDANVYFLGGIDTVLERSRISNTAGWASVFVPGQGGGGWPCGGIRVVDNLVDSYTAYHSWAVPGSSDGIGVTCHDVLVEGNHVIDASDAPLIMFTASWNDHTVVRNVVQRSQFVNNTVFQASSGVVGGITFSGLLNDPQSGAMLADADFTGSLASGNLLWSSPTREAHYDFLFAIGNRMWNPVPFASESMTLVRPRDANKVRGVSVIGNTTGVHGAVAQFIGGAAGAMDTVYADNDVTQLVPERVLMRKCGTAAPFVATYSGGWASFASTDQTWEDRSLLDTDGYGCALGSG